MLIFVPCKHGDGYPLAFGLGLRRLVDPFVAEGAPKQNRTCPIKASGSQMSNALGISEDSARARIETMAVA